MVKIRLLRVGRKKRPSYRVVVADARAPRNGATIEIIGHYNPLTDPPTIVIDEEKALKWLRQGAQPTERVAFLLNKLGIMEKPTKKHPEKPTKKPAKKPAKKPMEEITQETAEATAQETAEATAEETAEATAQETAEATAEETTEATVEETTEETTTKSEG